MLNKPRYLNVMKKLMKVSEVSRMTSHLSHQKKKKKLNDSVTEEKEKREEIKEENTNKKKSSIGAKKSQVFRAVQTIQIIDRNTSEFKPTLWQRKLTDRGPLKNERGRKGAIGKNLKHIVNHKNKSEFCRQPDTNTTDQKTRQSSIFHYFQSLSSNLSIKKDLRD